MRSTRHDLDLYRRRSVPGKDDQVWIWWMRPDGDSWRIADLVLNGRSAVNTEAHEYATVLQNNNGDMNALIAIMRKRAGQRSMYSPLAGAGVILCVRVRRSRISQVMVR
jgi:hypothetical protein